VLVGDEGRVEVYSQSLTRLTGSFPETAEAIGALVPRGTVLDGELVRWSAGTRLDFAALQRRLGAGRRRIFELARTEPVTLVAFDCLEAPGHGDLRTQPLHERRQVLEELLHEAPPAGLVLLCPQETSKAAARLWLELLTAQGVEGLVIAGRSPDNMCGT
jgi:ATP-dependent DNA ligase